MTPRGESGVRHFTMERCFSHNWLAAAAEHAPLATLALGETVTIDTANSRNADLFPGMVVETAPKRSEGYGNPVTGPFLIEGVKAGDWIAVHLEEIALARFGYIRRGGPFINRSRIVLEVAAGVDLAEVRNHLRRCLRVRGPDGSPLLFRFYDPRAFRVVIPTLDADSRKQFFGPIRGFYIEDREPGTALYFPRDGGREPRPLPLGA